MTRKDLKDNVLNHRMNLLINYYTNEEKLEQINRQKLIQYYKNAAPNSRELNNLSELKSFQRSIYNESNLDDSKSDLTLD
jgi:hypothetical protein